MNLIRRVIRAFKDNYATFWVGPYLIHWLPRLRKFEVQYLPNMSKK